MNRAITQNSGRAFMSPVMRAPTSLLAAGLLALANFGCESIGGRTVYTEFRNAEGLQSDRPVYVAGVQIGDTGTPRSVAGKARVPVRIWRSQRDALPAGSIFAIAPDPNAQNDPCLIVFDIPGVSPRFEGNEEIYSGASSELELALLMGADKAREIWELLGEP